MSLILGLITGNNIKGLEKLTLPAIGIIMTVSFSQFAFKDLFPLKKIIRPVLHSLFFNYGFSTFIILFTAYLLSPSPDIRIGFFLTALTPPGFSIIPFSHILDGDISLAVIGSFGVYLLSLLIVPLYSFIFIGENLIPFSSLFKVLLQIIIIPVLISRILIFSGINKKIKPYQGQTINWGFFLVIFSIVALNQKFFLSEPLALLRIFLICFLSVFLAGASL